MEVKYLRKLDGPTLLSIYESCKHFLDLDPSARFIEYSPPKNYDPLAMQWEIKKVLVTLGALLEEKMERTISSLVEHSLNGGFFRVDTSGV